MTPGDARGPSDDRSRSDASPRGAADGTAERSAALVRLQRALDEARIALTAEERGALAILTPGTSADGVRAELDAARRRWLVQAALNAGFSHVALEIPAPTSSDAALPGGHPA